MSTGQVTNHVEMIPFLQIRPNLLLYYQLPETSFRRSKLKNLLNRKQGQQPHHGNISNLKDSKTYSGQMTKGSVKRLRKAINTLVAIADYKEATNFKTGKKYRFKTNFITLTLPTPQANRTDKQIKKEVLDVWLKSAKRRFKLKSYVWRAEKQKNGNLHFHITTDTYIPFDQLRDSWNDRLERLNFITEFESKHGHRHPNSTDVHATYKVKDLASYMVKYMTKDNDDGLQVDGKLWDCSENLKAKIRCEKIVDSQTFEWLESIREKYPNQLKKMDQCALLWLTEKQFNQHVTGEYNEMYNTWKDQIKNYVKPSIQRRKELTKPKQRQPLKRTTQQLTLNLPRYSIITTNTTNDNKSSNSQKRKRTGVPPEPPPCNSTG